MRFFTCLIEPDTPFLSGDASPVSEVARRHYDAFARRRGLEHEWQEFGGVAVLTGWDDPWGDPLVATHGHNLAAGMVRLDNRDEIRRWGAHKPMTYMREDRTARARDMRNELLHAPGRSGGGDASSAARLTDLELVLRAVEAEGAGCVPALLGDFAFVVWDGRTGTIIAAVDAFAVKTLYYAQRGRTFAFSSRAEPLAVSDEYNRQYLAERVAMCIPTPGLTVFAGVHAVSAGHLLVVTPDGAPSVRRYWSAHEFETDHSWVRREQEAAETCRDLLADAVRLRLGGEGETWAELSGGMDSSSVVSTAQWLAQQGRVPHGLAGTVTYVETGGTGADEREYSDAVVNTWGLRNEQIIDAPTWHDDEYPPPLLDQPGDLAFYPRTRRLCEIVSGAGGKILLTGVGGDNLFLGTMFFFADWIARGHILRAVREMARRAAIGRVSFWELAYRNALLPLLPYFIQKSWVCDEGQTPSWIAPDAARRYGIGQRAASPRAYAGRVGCKYQDSTAVLITSATAGTAPGLRHDYVDVRHPYLSRPIVEFAITLPPELCVRPHSRKWVLRQAVRGVLPDVVRTRVGKGVLMAPNAASLVQERSNLEDLASDMMLADLGIVSQSMFRRAFGAVLSMPETRERISGAISCTLMTEAWLRSRSGLWPAEAHMQSRVISQPPSSRG
ncbi:MAG: asparagine synthase-related protein [Longimicrobiales bacterium]